MSNLLRVVLDDIRCRGLKRVRVLRELSITTSGDGDNGEEIVNPWPYKGASCDMQRRSMAMLIETFAFNFV